MVVYPSLFRYVSKTLNIKHSTLARMLYNHIFSVLFLLKYS